MAARDEHGRPRPPPGTALARLGAASPPIQPAPRAAQVATIFKRRPEAGSDSASAAATPPPYGNVRAMIDESDRSPARPSGSRPRTAAIGAGKDLNGSSVRPRAPPGRRNQTTPTTLTPHPTVASIRFGSLEREDSAPYNVPCVWSIPKILLPP
jgi:hypothetical protein